MRIQWLVIALVGCTTDPNPNGGQFGEEEGGCEAISTQSLAGDEVAPNGVRPDDLLVVAVGAHEHRLDWTLLDTSTDLTLTVAYDGGAMSFVDYEYDPGDGPAIEIGCEDLLEVEVDVSLVTADGALDEAFSGVLVAGTVGEARLNHALDEVAGTFDAWDYAPVDNAFDEMRAWVDVDFDKAGSAGVISGQGSGVIGDPDDPNSAAFAQAVDIGSWGDGEPER